MEIDDQIHCKFPRFNNGGAKLGHNRKMDDEEDGGIGRFYGWPSSRIVRVSRASGGKDRHSKVLTSKGLRDRRVRLSVNTAIQFYDLQDRLGYDQPSKAVEWLLKAAESSIAELPPMNSPFPDTPKQIKDEKRTSAGEMDLVTKSSACSSNSENSKGSGLSLSRSESRVRARERAKERVVEKESESTQMNPISHTTSFTELLNGGLSNNSSSPMEYFSSGMLAPPSSAPVNPFTAAFNELPRYSFAPDHFVPVVNGAAAAGGGGGSSQHQHYNLNFNRGTLQSNSSSLLPHLQRFSDGGAPSFFLSAAENHHQFVSGYDSRGLQLWNSGERGKDKN